MRRILATSSALTIGLVGLGLTPGVQAQDARHSALAAAAEVDPGDYGADDDFYFSYVGDGSASDCDGDASCDIVSTSFAVARSLPDDLLVVVSMAGATDPEMSNNESGGIWIFIDTDDEPSEFEYLVSTGWMSYPLDTFETSTVLKWVGESWEATDVEALFTRATDYWGAAIPWRELGIEAAAFQVGASGASGGYDYAPESSITEFLPIGELVDGPDIELVAPELTAASYKKKGKKATATVSWSEVAGATGYQVRWALNGKKKWSNWRSVGGTRIAIKGLIRDKSTKIEIRAVDESGTGPVATETIGWGPRFGQ